MGRYAMVRGWFECNFEDVKALKRIAEQHWACADNFQLDAKEAEQYWSGWSFPTQPLNWVSFVFYGAQMKEWTVPFLKSCIAKMAQLNTEVRGCYFVDDDEENDLRIWIVKSGAIIDEKRKSGSPPFEWEY